MVYIIFFFDIKVNMIFIHLKYVFSWRFSARCLNEAINGFEDTLFIYCIFFKQFINWNSTT